MKPHPVDGWSLTFGLFFIALATGWLILRYAGLTLATVGLVLTGGLVLLGVAGLAYILAPRPRRPADRSRE